MPDLKFPRGSEWRQWDFHVHTPASFEWKGGKRFCQMTKDEKDSAVDLLIDTINKADPAVFVLMDYWTFDGYLYLKKRLEDPNAPELEKTVFPGIELRLVSPTRYRLNAHVVFSNDITEQDLTNFKAKLEVALIKQPLSDECLVKLVQKEIGNDKLKLVGSSLEEVMENKQKALLAGSKIAEITFDSYSQAIHDVPEEKAIGFMPWDLNHGLEEVNWKNHYAFVKNTMNSCRIFETRKQDLWAAFSGIKTEENKNWFENFQTALGSSPRLAVSGSDAHSFAKYGEFPSGKATWIKADPTFLGLKQAIKEPAKRSFIGTRPKKLVEVEENKTFFIDSIEIKKIEKSSLNEKWLSDCKLSLSSDLIAIIGSKGSGKSALADVIALMGNSRQVEHFSFLSNKRFRKKPTELAKYFSCIIKWQDGSTPDSRLLSDDPPREAVEMVQYIPQAHFEKLCNDHVSGSSYVFEKELRSVIFSHTSPAIRQKSFDFEQLIDRQESIYRDQLLEYRKDLNRLNKDISGIEEQLQPSVKKALNELLTLKQKQIDEHKKIEPTVEKKPDEQLTKEQEQVLEDLKNSSVQLEKIEADIQASMAREEKIATQNKALEILKDRLEILQRQYKQFKSEASEYAATLQLSIADIVSIDFKTKALDTRAESILKEKKSIIDSRTAFKTGKQKLDTKLSGLKAKLNEPQKRYDSSLKKHKTWKAKLSDLIGKIDSPDTFEGIKERISQLEDLPKERQKKQENRIKLTGSIYDILDDQRKAREKLFAPVQRLIQDNSLIREEYKLQFQATLVGSSDKIASELFEIIKQNTGEFRGGEESYATVRRIAEKYDFNDKNNILDFVIELDKTIAEAASENNNGGIGISSLLRVNKEATDLYNLVFGLSFLEPRYSLLFQDTQIEQLSPGQRGSLLLIFYLLVDKARNPIILDQPEENLDNETVFNLLVPVLGEAKKKRQIIMVTHNPNLAVVCDAEQIIYSSFDRKKSSKISYKPGAIEDPIINRHVVDVLEGTMPAFDNRKINITKAKFKLIGCNEEHCDGL